MCFCVGALTLTTWHSSSDNNIIMCSGSKPIVEEHAKTVSLYQHSPGGVMKIHNFYVDDRDSPAILRGFASSMIGDEDDVQTVTPSSVYTLVWYSHLEPPAATICQVKNHNLPKPVLERDFSHVIECSLSHDGDVMPNYVSITHELCGDPVAYLPIRAYEQMDKAVVEFFRTIKQN